MTVAVVLNAAMSLIAMVPSAFLITGGICKAVEIITGWDLLGPTAEPEDLERLPGDW